MPEPLDPDGALELGGAEALAPEAAPRVRASAVWANVDGGRCFTAGDRIRSAAAHAAMLASFLVVGGLLMGGLEWFLPRQRAGHTLAGPVWDAVGRYTAVGAVFYIAVAAVAMAVGYARVSRARRRVAPRPAARRVGLPRRPGQPHGGCARGRTAAEARPPGGRGTSRRWRAAGTGWSSDRGGRRA